MSLNVKDPEAHRLAEAIARETGESLTKVVIDSLRERHDKLRKTKGKPTLAEIMALVDRTAETLTGPAPDHGEMLYDEYGLPK
jgi:antitoxin VapB